MNANAGTRDHSKIDGIPDERWSLAEIVYSSRLNAAWGNHHNGTPPPRLGYSHGKQTADFDLALAVAKALLEAGYGLRPSLR